jgi:phage gp36-like protein
MPYAAAPAFISAFGATEAADLQTDDPDRLAQALTRASAEADSYLCARYAAPVLQPGDALVQCVLDIARFRLWDRRAPDEVRQRYEDAMRWLRDVAAGRAVLLTSAGLPAAPATAQAPGAAAVSARPVVYDSAFASAYERPTRPTFAPGWPL